APQLWVIPLSFIFLIAVGTLFFKLPFSLNPGVTLTWTDAFFTATSAVCITGLSTITVGDVFSLPGQMMLLFLVQMGGVGIFTSSLIMVVVVGQRLSLADEQVIQATIGKMKMVRPVDVFIYACFFIFFFETLGAILYLLGLVNLPSYEIMSNVSKTELKPMENALFMLWDSIFHSVNAFCNSGFSLYPEGMLRMKNNPYFLSLVGMLVFIGSLGLMTMINLRFYYFWRRNAMMRGSLLLQTKVTVLMTLLTVLIGMVAFLSFEWDGTLQERDGTWLKIVTSFFHSVNARSGGLNSVDLSDADTLTLSVMMMLMFIGGGSGSMAGGIKVTTFFVIVLAVYFVLRRREHIQIFERRIPSQLVHVALMIGFLYTVGMALGTFCVIGFESGEAACQLKQGWLGVVFDCVSAFGTVGLSTGVTPSLTIYSKWVLMGMMFVGRILTLSLSVYLLRPWEKSYVKYPEEQIALG
ncbi:MAG: hypothetical protein J5672_02150, partial [Verrucomicrobia bacterium]|nr:hypothetical protein [Verrucomicrobiota bacterium]